MRPPPWGRCRGWGECSARKVHRWWRILEIGWINELSRKNVSNVTDLAVNGSDLPIDIELFRGTDQNFSLCGKPAKQSWKRAQIHKTTRGNPNEDYRRMSRLGSSCFCIIGKDRVRPFNWVFPKGPFQKNISKLLKELKRSQGQSFRHNVRRTNLVSPFPNAPKELGLLSPEGLRLVAVSQNCNGEEK